MTYYHFSRIPLKVGTVLNGGIVTDYRAHAKVYWVTIQTQGKEEFIDFFRGCYGRAKDTVVRKYESNPGEEIVKNEIDVLVRNEIKYATEGLLEYVRYTYYSDLKSRLECSYLSDSLQWCKNYASINKYKNQFFYEVDVNNSPIAKYDMSIYNKVQDLMIAIFYSGGDKSQQFDDAIAEAKRYWDGEIDNPNEIELLVPDGNAKVVKQAK